MATPVSENPIIVDLADTYGCILVGCFLSCMIWGISSLQTFLYYARYESDHWNKKLLIAVLWVIDTVNEIIVLMSVWPVLIKNYGSIAGLSTISPELVHHAWIAQLLELSVQLFFIHRIWLFSGKKWLFPAFMVTCSLFQLFVIIPYDIIVYGGGAQTSDLASHTATSIVIALRAVTAAEDILLSSTLIYLVLKNGLPQFERSRRMAVRIVVVTVNTGLWTAVVALAELIMVAVYPNGLQFTVLEFPLCSLYFSTLLACLNSREYVKGAAGSVWNETPSSLTGGTRTTAAGSDTLYLGRLGSASGTHRATQDSPSMVKIAGYIDGEDAEYPKRRAQSEV